MVVAASTAVAAIGWFFGRFFDDREKKIRDARIKMEQHLKDNIEKELENIKNLILDWFHKNLINDVLQQVFNAINDMTTSIFNLSDAQYDFATKINEKLKSNNLFFINEAFKYLDYNLDKNIIDIARLPGYAIFLLIQPNTRLPEKQINDIRVLLNEKIYFIIDSNKYSKLSQGIGKEYDKRKISIEKIQGKDRIAHLFQEIKKESEPRLRLTQQLMQLLIIK